MPLLAPIENAAPRKEFGKVAREPGRYSGRTSILANISIHEPKPPSDPEEVRRRPPEPTPEHVAKAESLTRVIRDEELRKVVAKTAAASLSRDDNDRSFC